MTDTDDTDDRVRRWRALGEAPPESLRPHLADSVVLSLPAATPPWTATGITLARGDAFSLFAVGGVERLPGVGLWNGPRSVLWARVGGRGPLLNGTQDAATFEAPRDGALELGLGLAEWSSRDGAADPAIHAIAKGEIAVLVVRWRGAAGAGLDALAGAAPGEALFAAARERYHHPVPRPEGWDYLWLLGEADIFTRGEHAGEPTIRARARDDVGILQTPVSLAFGPDTTLSWRWRVDALPSAVAEDSLLTHDYLSLAVEFGNGQDLTYYWSARLAPGTHYRCPLPNWDRRETHWVVRSGREGLGQWHAEERPLFADYRAAVGEPPARIVAVWLIAVSLFQKGLGQAEFAGVTLRSGGQVCPVIQGRATG